MARLAAPATALLALAFSLAFGPAPRPEPGVSPARAQGLVLTVRVLEDGTRQPLPNAEAIDLESGVRRFTNAAGETRLPWPNTGHLRLRIRQLGFQYIDREVRRTDATADTLTVALVRVAYVLPDVNTRVTSQCDAPSDSAARLLSAGALGQLRMGAERYDAFRKAYPFKIRQLRRTIRFVANGTGRQVRENEEEETSDRWGEPYRPGKVIHRTGDGFSVPVLIISTLASPVFWEHHCFGVDGMQTLEERRVLRLAFTPAPSVKDVDWLGVAYLDSATSLLRRIEFQLTGLRDDDVPRRLEGFTTFRSPSPFIAMPDSTVAMWWRRDPETVSSSWGGPDVVQLLRLMSVKYRKTEPPR